MSLLPTVRSTVIALVGLVLFLFIAFASAAPEPDRNPLNIDWHPAPAPEDGPPLSASASRDKSLLGAQVGAIVGAWVFFVLILGGYLHFIGRRLRADALRGCATLDVEMVKPTLSSRNFDPSPITPTTNSASPSKAGMPNFSWPSPTKQNFPTFDERVIQHDKEQREREMEELYAAVMEHNASGSGARNSSKPDRLSPKDASKTGGTGSLGRMKSPKLLRALTSPTFPSLKSPSAAAPKSPSQQQQPKTPSPEKKKDDGSHHRNRSSSFSSSSPSKNGSSKNRGSGHTVSIRNLPISKPMPTPTFSLHSRAPASDEEPLTPRYPPPTPPDSTSPHQSHHHGPTASVSSIATTSTMTRRTPELISTTIQLAKPPTRQLAGPGTSRSPDPSVRSRTASPPHYPYQQQQISPPASPLPPSMRSGTQHHQHHHHQQQQQQSSGARPGGIRAERTGGPTPPPQLRTTPITASGSTNTLPLRSLNTALGYHHPSANTTKVTIVERPENLQTGLKTAGPPVPYSPYMPFTPVTPITPGLVTKRERKAREKHGGRGRKVVTEMVRDEGEMWKGGY